MGDAAVECPGEVFAGEEAEDEAGGEGVASAYAVEDVEVGEVETGEGFRCFTCGSAGESEGAPAVAVGGVGVADGGGEDVEIGELGGDALGHGAEGVEGVPGGAVGIVGEGVGEVAFVAEEDVDHRHEGAVDFDGTLAAAAGLPERGAVVAVKADDGTVTTGGGDGLVDDFGGAFAERGHDAASVEPADGFVGEEGVPWDVAGAELGDGGVAAVHHAEAGADAEAAFEEVDAVAGGAAYAVEG